jgi:hypothetical protein
MKKKIPIFESHEEAERFVETADLSEYDFSQFKPVRFEFARKDARVNTRLPEPLLVGQGARQSPRHPLPALHPRGPREGRGEEMSIRQALAVQVAVSALGSVPAARAKRFLVSLDESGSSG